MLFLVLFWWLRRCCGAILGGQWVFLGGVRKRKRERVRERERKRESRSRDRGYGRERSTERDVQTKVSELARKLIRQQKRTNA